MSAQTCPVCEDMNCGHEPGELGCGHRWCEGDLPDNLRNTCPGAEGAGEQVNRIAAMIREAAILAELSNDPTDALTPGTPGWSRLAKNVLRAPLTARLKGAL
jgi:hypothetical protein